MTETFTDWLRQRSEPDWTAVVTHPFTQGLFDGLVPVTSMRSYLVQDYQFVDDFLALLGSALAKADRYSSRLAIAGSIAVVTSEENTYFQRAFDALGVGEADRVRPKLDEATVAFRELISDTNARGSYAEVLTVLTVAEWTYLEWAMRAPAALPENFVHAEWITLHNNPDFQSWVRWLCRELDRVGADLDERDRARCLRLFQHATRCELDFFNTHSP
ncbi:TenA family protein [Saccharopolyspora spinosa]|uniref:Aminopyrimidine aminohydrolase n=1 Tax=Saccharopolyspora spinosa TaxID=60894 RepID=A0A2N3XRG8_SACSN|nr:TenA family protein [Saccharopolyspora spinosa]PKW13231.1 thiaminase/transcriptional activator TenA [Saccharopolyspora spinosa]